MGKYLVPLLLPMAVLAGSMLISLSIVWHSFTGRWHFYPSDKPDVFYVTNTMDGTIHVRTATRGES